MRGERGASRQPARVAVVMFVQIRQVLLVLCPPLRPHRVLLHGHREEALRLQGGKLPADAAARRGEAEGMCPRLLTLLTNHCPGLCAEARGEDQHPRGDFHRSAQPSSSGIRS